jgi:uncharacterized membrane protein
MSEFVEARHEPDPALAPVYLSAIRVLNGGFRVGAALLIIGLVVAAAKRESLNHEVESFGQVFPAVFDGKASGIIDLAILTLMITPLITVVVVATGFMRAGDRRYGLLSFVVLGVLGVSVTLSLLR